MFVLLIQQGSHLLDHVVVDVAVPGECLGAFAVAREFADEVRVFDLLIEVADEGAAGHMRAGDVTDGMLLRLLRSRVDDGDNAIDAGFLESLTDEVIKFSGAIEGEDSVLRSSFVALQNLNGGGCQVHLDYARAFLFCLAGDVLHGDAVVGGDYVVLGEGEEVTDTAADVALEDEDVPCCAEILVVTHIRLVQEVTFLGGEVVGGAILLGAYGILAEGVVLGVAHIHTPAPICTNGAHIADNGIVASLTGSAFMLGVVPGIFVFLDGTQTGAVFHLVRLEEGVLGPEEILKGYEGVRSGLVEDDLLAGIQLKAMDDAEDRIVRVYALRRYFLMLQEVLGFVQEAQLVTVGFGVVLGEEETVDSVLRPVLVELVDRLVVALLDDMGNDSVNLRFCFQGITDLGSNNAVLNEDLAVDEVLRQDESVGVGT